MKASFADFLIFAGLALAGVGLWLYDPRLSLTVVGAVMFALGIVGSR